ncbi:MAG: ASKHA domain-containing protein, partial [Syntrophobacteraceae bacterium]
QPAHWSRRIDCLPETTAVLCADWGIHPEAFIEVMPPLAGFVGSDLLAGVFASRLLEKGPGTLLIDFGTNSEVALWDGGSLWVTSAAGGPAFEGCGVGCGTPAEPGAIYRVRLSGRTSAQFADDIEFLTIDDEKPRGLCGSGIVDLIACLLKSGRLTSIGRFSPGISDGRIVILNGDTLSLQLTKRDVDIFQRAKAAIFAAVRVLLSKASMSPKELRHLYVGGVFGHFLDRESAAAVGLLPDLSGDAVELCGNTALRGCEELLMSSGSAEVVEGLRGRAKLVNLAQCGEFDDFFLEGLYLARWADPNVSRC